MSKRHRVPATRAVEPSLKAYAWPCGCVTLNSRTGPLERDCGNPACYRRTAYLRPNLRRLR